MGEGAAHRPFFNSPTGHYPHDGGSAQAEADPMAAAAAGFVGGFRAAGGEAEWAQQGVGRGAMAAGRAEVSPFLACIGSPCLRHRVHGASIGGGGGGGARGGGEGRQIRTGAAAHRAVADADDPGACDRSAPCCPPC
jgi:hypothetical protein